VRSLPTHVADERPGWCADAPPRSAGRMTDPPPVGRVRRDSEAGPVTGWREAG
jgi:hypothetical protein